MISIIVCHRDQRLLNDFQFNVEQSIGVDFEFIVIDNSKMEYSIFEAYNLGIQKSKGDVICFAHEDLEIQTKNWGRKVLDHFQEDKVNMIGVAGGNGFPKSPSWWWNNQYGNQHLAHLIQVWSTKTPKQGYNVPIPGQQNKTLMHVQNQNSVREKAVCVDGLWFCVRRSIFDSGVQFDETTFKGFHCYDTDISIQIHQKFSGVFIVFDILMEHFSDANANKEFYDSCFLHFQKWKSVLPIVEEETALTIDTDRYSLLAQLDYYYVLKSSGFYSDKEIRQRISATLKDLPKRFDFLEFHYLFWWSILGYRAARIPNKIAKFLLK